MGVEVRQLPMRDGGIEPELRVKALSEIGPTTYEPGKAPHIGGTPVAEILAAQSGQADQGDPRQAESEAEESAKKPKSAKAVEKKADK